MTGNILYGEKGFPIVVSMSFQTTGYIDSTSQLLRVWNKLGDKSHFTGIELLIWNGIPKQSALRSEKESHWAT